MDPTSDPYSPSDPERVNARSSVCSTRSEALIGLEIERLQFLDDSSVATVQRLLRHGNDYGKWFTPREWFPPGKQDTTRLVDLRARVMHYMTANLAQEQDSIDPRLLDHAVLLLSRYLLLLRLGPAGMGMRAKFLPLSPTSIANIAYSAGPALAALGASCASMAFHSKQGQQAFNQGQFRLFANIDAERLAKLSAPVQGLVTAEAHRMSTLAERGLWRDAPSFWIPIRSEAMTAAAEERSVPSERDSHLPLPDEYVAKMGRRSLWLIRDLAPNIFEVAAQMIEVWRSTSELGFAPVTVRDRRRIETEAVLARHHWRDHTGQPMQSVPFEVWLPKLTGYGRVCGTDEEDLVARWPPRTHRDVMALLGAIQMAHYFVVAMSMGGRQSEVLSLQRDCVRYLSDGNGYASGRTFKLVFRLDGELREWQLPQAATEAVEQQVRLTAMAEQISDLMPQVGVESHSPHPAGHLWSQVSSGAMSAAEAPLRDINRYLKRFAITIGMDRRPGNQNFRSHRFRKTLARLMALALVQAPSILMDVFGHRSIEMTMYYILTDKDLRAEIATVERELRVMRAKLAIELIVESEFQTDPTTSRGGYGGLAAFTIERSVEAYREHVHRRGETWGASSAYELAELLTLQGSAWDQVRKGVVCTKLPGEAGPCNKSKGRPEPSACRSSCIHRLEEAFLRDDVEASIEEAVRSYELASASDDALLASHWAGQIRAHVCRFPDIQERWSSHLTVMSLLGTSAPTTRS